MIGKQVQGILELQSLSNAQKIILITLNSRVGEGRVGLFTYGEIATAAGISIRTVRRAIPRLVALSLIVIDVHICASNRPSTRRCCVYRIECLQVIPLVDEMIQRLHELLFTSESTTGDPL